MLGAAAACFTGDATLGALCRADSDCGGGQACDNEVCGLCGDGVAQPGELCFVLGESIDLGAVPVIVRPQDVDRDAVIDLITLAPGQAELVVLRGQTGGFANAEAVALPGPADLFAVGDLDGDGTVDAVTADAELVRFGAGSGSLVFSFGSEDLAWPGTSTLLFVAGTEEAPAFTLAARAAPDAQTEVVALEVAADGVLRIGPGVTLPGTVLPMASGDVVPGGTAEVALAIGATVSVRSGAMLTEVAELPMASEVATVALVDANGDGNRDVLSADVLGNVVIDAGDGEGGFTRGATLSVPAGPRALVVGDLDRDGDRDIASAHRDVGLVLALAQGTRFDETVELPGPAAAGDVLVANLDGDVLAELIVVSADSGELAIVEVQP